MQLKLADKIIVDDKILHGKPVIEGTRIPVHSILELLSNGLTADEIIKDYYEHIKKEDIFACIRYAKSLIENEEICLV